MIFSFLVGGTGFEPVTSCASSKHSTTELTAHTSIDFSNQMEAALGFEPRMKDLQSSAFPLGYAALIYDRLGAENGIRTRDPRLGKAMLYH